MFSVKKIIILVFLTISYKAFSNINAVTQSLKSVNNNTRLYDQVVNTMVENGYYFTAIAFAKEYLATTLNATVNSKFEASLERLITEVGVKQFETMPDNILKRSSNPIIRYIRAKKLFKRGDYQKAFSLIKDIKDDHSIAPFSMMLKASILSLNKNYDEALNVYDDCESVASSVRKSSDNKIRRKQLTIARDYCLIGKARTLFSQKKYEKANLAYLDLDKESFVWPEILFEEAWTSFFQGNYNRTLGKLVTYRAPVFEHFFIPEIDILKALTYMEMCLWSDAKKEVDGFYQKYSKPAAELVSFIKRKGKDYDFYYKVAKVRSKNRVKGGELFNSLVRSVINEPGYQELNYALNIGVSEFNRIKVTANGRERNILLRAIKDSVIIQKRLIGSFVRKQVVLKYALLKKAFSDMSYIKLEVLSRNKSELYYRETDAQRERGDIKYLKRNEKQYFWSFNGEFWADELGDYVFALASECKS